MTFVVESDPEVLRTVSALSPVLQDFFKQQVVSILRETPYEFREIIQAGYDDLGRLYHRYYDGIIPLVFQYRVYPPVTEWVDGQPGYVWIMSAIPDN